MEYFSWIPQPVWIAGVFVVMYFALNAARAMAWNRLDTWAGKQTSSWQKELLRKIKTPASLLSLLIAAGVAVQLVPDEFRGHHFLGLSVKIAFIAVGMLIVDRAASVLLVASGFTQHFSRSMRFLFLTGLRIILFSLGALVILETLGISITPILASLGVGSVAVALALQDTLSNFFSGIYLLVDEPVRLGDFVRLEDGSEGTVEQIGWRSTRVRTPSDAMVVVPNSKLASARVTNFDSPNKEIGFAIELGVSYDADLAHVERVTLEVAAEILRNTPGGVAEFQPLLRFTRFGESSIDLAVVLRAAQFGDQGLLKHEFIKTLHARYRKEGISIPYPHRVIETIAKA